MIPAADTRSRTRARSWVLQLLYGWDLSGEPDLSDYVARALPARNMSPRYRPYVRHLLSLVEAHRSEIDRTIDAHVENWRPERLAAIDRNVLRIGAAELLYSADVPPRVAISEAVGLAAKYGGQESPGFVNGVLDAIHRSGHARTSP